MLSLLSRAVQKPRPAHSRKRRHVDQGWWCSEPPGPQPQEPQLTAAAHAMAPAQPSRTPPEWMAARSGVPAPPAPSTRCSSGTRWWAACPSCPRSAVPTAMEPEGGWKCRRVTTFSPLTSARRTARRARADARGQVPSTTARLAPTSGCCPNGLLLQPPALRPQHASHRGHPTPASAALPTMVCSASHTVPGAATVGSTWSSRLSASSSQAWTCREAGAGGGGAQQPAPKHMICRLNCKLHQSTCR